VTKHRGLNYYLMCNRVARDRKETCERAGCDESERKVGETSLLGVCNKTKSEQPVSLFLTSESV
jgi:hypothetical protein